MEPSAIHSTFVIERSFSRPPGLVFSAFAEPGKKRRWFAEGSSHDVEEFVMDFRVGGTERARSRFREGTRFPGVIMLSEGRFHDIVPERRIVSAAPMSIGDHRISAALITFEFLATETGTDLIFTHQAAFFEGSDGPEMREAGWSKLLDQLTGELAAELVTPELAHQGSDA
jgi:uncharacterized protein YndB with AHSA1/START domain